MFSFQIFSIVLACNDRTVCIFSMAEMSIDRNVRGRNVRGRNVLADTSVSEMSVAEMYEHQEKHHNFSSENYLLYSREKLQYITWVCFRNVKILLLLALKKNIFI